VSLRDPKDHLLAQNLQKFIDCGALDSYKYEYLTMLHKPTIWLLLPLMLLNGLWMVCDPPGMEEPPVNPEEFADCIRICASLEAEFGKICILWPGDTKPSITIFDFGTALLPEEIVLHPVATEEQFMTAWSVLYSNPGLSKHTPPPKA
jgi:hypothetical protein